MRRLEKVWGGLERYEEVREGLGRRDEYHNSKSLLLY
jgi:hypothetical protein